MRGTSRRRARRPKFSRLVEAYQQAHPAGIQRLNPHHQAHLLRFFGQRPVTTQSATDYALKRQDAGAAVDLVNDELRALGHVLRFAVQRGELPRVPEIWFVPTSRTTQNESFQRRPSNWFFDRSIAVAGDGRAVASAARFRSKDIWSQFWTKYRPDMQKTPDGEPMTDTWRLGRLRLEFGLKRSRSAMVRQRAKALKTR